MDQKKIGKFIAKCRKDLNLTQEQLGSKLGITSKTISRWENGNYMPDVSLFKPLCSELKIDVSELLNGERAKEKNPNSKANEKILLDTINYSIFNINERKKFVYILIVGFVLLLFGLTSFNGGSWRSIFQISGLILISIGICAKQKKGFVKGIIVFLIGISSLMIVDYYGITKLNREPVFSFLIISSDKTITYKSLLYDVHRCNRDTNDEYYEIDFARKGNKCNNPFDPNKSDISRLIKYKNKYLGNNSNTVNLFYTLPLSNYGFSTEIDSDNLILKINYNNTTWYIEEDNNNSNYLKKSLIYNSITAFSLIENLKEINYNFVDTHYTITRKDIEEKYPNYFDIKNSDKSINIDNFHKYIDYKINDNIFIDDTFEKIFISN